jgi:hypothetical protein
LGVGGQVEFKKVNSSSGDYMDVIRGKIGTGEITLVNVPEMLHNFILLNGVLQPFILETETWDVWEMTGLGKYFSRCRSISPGQRRMTFGGVEGLADIWPKWSFDFGNGKDLIVTFKVEGAW